MIDYLVKFFIFPLIVLSFVCMLIYGLYTAYTEDKCLDAGYSGSKITWDFSQYCTSKRDLQIIELK